MYCVLLLRTIPEHVTKQWKILVKNSIGKKIAGELSLTIEWKRKTCRVPLIGRLPAWLNLTNLEIASSNARKYTTENIASS